MGIILMSLAAADQPGHHEVEAVGFATGSWQHTIPSINSLNTEVAMVAAEVVDSSTTSAAKGFSCDILFALL